RGVRVRVRERAEGAGPRRAHGRPARSRVAGPRLRAARAPRAVTLGRLVGAWLPVAILFAVAPPIGYRWDQAIVQNAVVWSFNRWNTGWGAPWPAVGTFFARRGSTPLVRAAGGLTSFWAGQLVPSRRGASRCRTG